MVSTVLVLLIFFVMPQPPTYRLHRATWVSTELMLTFPPPAIQAITIIPLNSEDTGGRFRVWLHVAERQPVLLWDRKVEGGFPELKVLVSHNRPQIKQE